MKDERPFTPCISNSKIRAMLIKKAASRIFFLAPGISREEILGIEVVQNFLNEGSINLILDVSQESFKNGYWGDLTPAQLSEYAVKFQHASVLDGLRLGILVVDNQAWIFTPTPQSIEGEIESGKPNCLELNASVTKLLVESLTASSGTDRQTLPKLDKTLLEKVQQEIAISSTPIPSQKRLLEVLRPRLKIIQFEIRGYKITQQSIRLPREVIDIIGSSERVINDRINADWKVFASTTELEIERFQKDLEKDIEEIKNRHLIRLGQYGFGLVQSENQAFYKAWNKFQSENLKNFREIIRQKIANLVEQSQKMLYRLLEERAKKGTLNIPRQRTLFPVSEDELTDRYLKNIIERIHWPTVDKVLKNLVVKYRSYDLSEQLLQDDEFMKLLETNFGSLESWFLQTDPQPNKPAIDVHGFFLN